MPVVWMAAILTEEPQIWTSKHGPPSPAEDAADFNAVSSNLEHESDAYLFIRRHYSDGRNFQRFNSIQGSNCTTPSWLRDEAGGATSDRRSARLQGAGRDEIPGAPGLRTQGDRRLDRQISPRTGALRKAARHRSTVCSRRLSGAARRVGEEGEGQPR